MNWLRQLFYLITCGPDRECDSCGERCYWHYQADHVTICDRCDDLFDVIYVEWGVFNA